MRCEEAGPEQHRAVVSPLRCPTTTRQQTAPWKRRERRKRQAEKEIAVETRWEAETRNTVMALARWPGPRRTARSTSRPPPPAPPAWTLRPPAVSRSPSRFPSRARRRHPRPRMPPRPRRRPAPTRPAYTTPRHRRYSAGLTSHFSRRLNRVPREGVGRYRSIIGVRLARPRGKAAKEETTGRCRVGHLFGAAPRSNAVRPPVERQAAQHLPTARRVNGTLLEPGGVTVLNSSVLCHPGVLSAPPRTARRPPSQPGGQRRPQLGWCRLR